MRLPEKYLISLHEEDVEYAVGWLVIVGGGTCLFIKIFASWGFFLFWPIMWMITLAQFYFRVDDEGNACAPTV